MKCFSRYKYYATFFFLTFCKCVRYLSFNCLITWHFKLDSNEAAVYNGTLWWQSLETQNENGLSYLPLIIEKTLKNWKDKNNISYTRGIGSSHREYSGFRYRNRVVTDVWKNNGFPLYEGVLISR